MRPLRVLFIGNTENDVELISRELEKSGFYLHKKQINSIEHLRMTLAERWDLIISDCDLPGCSDLDALRLSKELASNTPFIVLSSQIGEETAINLMRAGAKDVISRSSLSRLVPAVQRELIEADHLRRLELAEEAIYEATLKAEAANHAKAQFLANVSHEIRTPLGAILGFTELSLSSVHNPADLMNCLYSIQRNGRQLMRLIDDLLDMAKVEAGKTDAEKIEVSIPEILHEIHSAFHLRAESKGVRFLVEFETPIPRTIVSDPTKIKQILMSLLGNALTFTDIGTVRLKVRHARGSHPDELGHMMFRVQDTGIGISAEHIHRLFTPFTQAETSTTRRFGGTGLGLAISHKLATILGGELTLESTDFRKGNIFALRIPSDPAHETAFIERFEIRRSCEPFATASADKRLSAIT